MDIITQRDVAKAAGTSRSTVSKVMNNIPGSRVNHKTRKKIIDAIEGLNYHPNAMGRGLVLNKTRNIGIVLYHMRYLASQYFCSMMGGIGETIDANEYNLQFSTSYNSGRISDNIPFMRLALERRVDGLIIIDQLVPDKEILRLKDYGIPFVLVDRKIDGDELNVVLFNDYQGIYKATEHLIELGHRKIGFLRGNPKLYEHREKLRGYKEALEKHGIKYNTEFVTYEFESDPDNFPETSRLLRNMLCQSERPTALLCCRDGLTLVAVETIRAMGLRIPDDISLIGFTNPLASFSMKAPLTVIDIPTYEMGKASAEMLLQLINGEKLDRREIIFEPKLITGESCMVVK